MGALAIDLVAIADAETFKATTVQVLQGDDPDDVTEECVTFVSKAASNVKAGDVVASFTLPKRCQDICYGETSRNRRKQRNTRRNYKRKGNPGNICRDKKAA